MDDDLVDGYAGGCGVAPVALEGRDHFVLENGLLDEIVDIHRADSGNDSLFQFP